MEVIYALHVYLFDRHSGEEIIFYHVLVIFWWLLVAKDTMELVWSCANTILENATSHESHMQLYNFKTDGSFDAVFSYF